MEKVSIFSVNGTRILLRYIQDKWEGVYVYDKEGLVAHIEWSLN